MTNEQEIKNLVKDTISKTKQELYAKIDKFWDQHLKIMNQDLPLDEKLSQIKELIAEYKAIQNNDDSRNAQRDHKNNDEPLARNRHIIKAELDQHLLQYDDNWDSNQDHAGGKYTLKKKEEWLEKKTRLENELRLFN